MNPLPVIRAELRRSRLAASAVVLLIAIAVAFGIAVAAQERPLRQGSARAADGFDLLVGAPGSQVQLVLTAVFLQPASVPLIPGEVLRRLQVDPLVDWAAPIAFGDRWVGHPVVGSTEAFVTRGGRERLAEGRLFAGDTEAVVGADVALPLGAQLTPAHGMAETGEAHGHEGVAYTVVGRMKRHGTPWDRAIVVPVEAMWEIHGLPTGHGEAETIGPPWEGETGGVPAIVVRPKSVAAAYRLRGQLRSGTTMALFPAEVLVELYATLGDVRAVLSVIAVASQALVIAAVLLAIFAVLALRRRQLAILRALGAPRRFVFAVVWGIVAALTVAGSLAGLALGWLGALAFAWLIEMRTGLSLPVALGAGEAVMVLMIIAAGCLLAVLPAWASYRAPIVEGLRA